MSTESLLEKLSIEQPDALCYKTSTPGNIEDVQDYLIFFLPGNPGLISYYEPFLSTLRSLLASSADENARFHICGHSYKGFEISPYSESPAEPVGLNQQIEYQENLLIHHVNNQHTSTGRSPKVILIGHSVGSYVLLEIIQRHWDAVDKKDVDDFDLIGGILLFPTIADIAKSPMGRVAKLVLPLPGFAQIIGAIARSLAYVLPATALTGLVKIITRFPEYAANTTASLLQSPMGVRQALYLAKDELNMIGPKEWDSEVWAAKSCKGTNKRDTINWNLVLFWGKGDKWVADQTRDNIIAQSQQATQGPGESEDRKWEMETDEEGLPHDFCTTIRNSNNVAGKVKGWIDDIIERHNKAL